MIFQNWRIKKTFVITVPGWKWIHKRQRAQTTATTSLKNVPAYNQPWNRLPKTALKWQKYAKYNNPGRKVWFNIKMPSYQYRKYHCGDNTILLSSYLHNGISYTGKMTSLYWIRTQMAIRDISIFDGCLFHFWYILKIPTLNSISNHVSNRTPYPHPIPTCSKVQ